ncbi:outer membrane beta-barrel family protein [Taibaiella chishuiensis]|uniref:Outer membrane receptor protein involved in Fe transport n=1 Tax=Taibaiella chishuiensis TaxID=1434707 RepID=A0A2P8CXT2_9BACT|nr:outer membrane beta-barrel family protein [Taibaiella chishuiensis]PSK89772.1 outer membrane receptor protein involved in Fe transport [Taibaiella chishuiensis]
MKSAIIAILLGLFFFLPATAQTNPYILQGTIRNPEGMPLDIATVQLLNADGASQSFTQSDSLGQYRFEIARKGTYHVKVSYLGYTPGESAGMILEQDSTYTLPDLVLQPSASNDLKQVTITATKNLYEQRPDKLIMNVENNPIAAGNSVFQLLRQAPAVGVDKDENLQLKGATVQIYIDGKPAFLSGTQLTEYLKNLPADLVATVEIIAQPSGRFEAAGSAGIINIRLKKNKVYGLNGSANLGAGVGRYPKANSGLNINYRKGKWNLFGNAYAGYGESYNWLTLNSKINGTQPIYQERDNYWRPRTHWLSYSGGVDYYLTEKSVLGLLINGESTKEKAITTNSTIFKDAAMQPYQYINSTKDDNQRSGNNAYNLNYKTTLDSAGSELSANLDYARYDRKATDINTNLFRSGSQEESRSPYIFRNTQPATVNFAAAKVDYNLNLRNKMRIETGARYSYVNSDNNLKADSLRNGDWTPDGGRSNHFIYREQIAAAYATWTAERKSSSLQLGLRAEHTQGSGEAITLGQVNKRSYLSLFPTLFFSQKLDTNNSLNFSYGRRIQRPDYQSLNPFVMFVDPYTVFEGNPNLQPSFSHAFELKHTYKQLLFTSLSYRYTKDAAIMVIQQDAATGATRNISSNGETAHQLILNVFIQLNPTSWWSTQNYANLIATQAVSHIPGYSYDTRALAGYFNSNHTFSVKHGIKIQTDFYYGIPRKDGLAKIQSEYAWNLGVQKQFLGDRLTVKCNATNIIGTYAYRAHYLGQGLDIRWRNEWEGRRVNISFSYKFGSQKIKAARDRDISSDEKSRIRL